MGSLLAHLHEVDAVAECAHATRARVQSDGVETDNSGVQLLVKVDEAGSERSGVE